MLLKCFYKQCSAVVSQQNHAVTKDVAAEDAEYSALTFVFVAMNVVIGTMKSLPIMMMNYLIYKCN